MWLVLWLTLATGVLSSPKPCLPLDLILLALVGKALEA